MKLFKYLTLLALATLLSIQLSYATSNTSDKQVTLKKPVIISDFEKWGYMIGKWYGRQSTKEGGTKQELMTRSADGTYVVQFTVERKDGSKVYQTEAGHWGISGNIYFSIYRGWFREGKLIPSDSSNPHNYDAYQILELNNDKFQYKHANSGNEYIVNKVAPDFKLTK